MPITTNKNFSIIVAIASNNAIGKNNQLLWHISEDFQWFKKHTLNHTVIMGKNTYLSLPKKPLPLRRNIVITDNKNDFFEGVEIVYSVDEAIEKADEFRENFIIGGASVYQQFMPLANKLYITFVHKFFAEADTFFPQVDDKIWKLDKVFEQQQIHPEGLKYEFRIYNRQNK